MNKEYKNVSITRSIISNYGKLLDIGGTYTDTNLEMVKEYLKKSDVERIKGHWKAVGTYIYTAEDKIDEEILKDAKTKVHS